MTTADLMTNLSKHFSCTYDMNETVANYRRQNLNWNWVDAAKNLLKELENKNGI
jgi:hypothetical protein